MIGPDKPRFTVELLAGGYAIMDAKQSDGSLIGGIGIHATAANIVTALNWHWHWVLGEDEGVVDKPALADLVNALDDYLALHFSIIDTLKRAEAKDVLNATDVGQAIQCCRNGALAAIAKARVIPMEPALAELLKTARKMHEELERFSFEPWVACMMEHVNPLGDALKPFAHLEVPDDRQAEDGG